VYININIDIVKNNISNDNIKIAHRIIENTLNIGRVCLFGFHSETDINKEGRPTNIRKGIIAAPPRSLVGPAIKKIKLKTKTITKKVAIRCLNIFMDFFSILHLCYCNIKS